eukprot:2973499-Heterocapsa_arctica.AAC.1
MGSDAHFARGGGGGPPYVDIVEVDGVLLPISFPVSFTVGVAHAIHDGRGVPVENASDELSARNLPILLSSSSERAIEENNLLG